MVFQLSKQISKKNSGYAKDNLADTNRLDYSSSATTKDDSQAQVLSSQALAEQVLEASITDQSNFLNSNTWLVSSIQFLRKCKFRFLLKAALVINFLLFNLFLVYVQDLEGTALYSDYCFFGGTVFLALTFLALLDEVYLRAKIISNNLKNSGVTNISKIFDSSTNFSFSTISYFCFEIVALVLATMLFITLLSNSPYGSIENFYFKELLFLVVALSLGFYLDLIIINKANQLAKFDYSRRVKALRQNEAGVISKESPLSDYEQTDNEEFQKTVNVKYDISQFKSLDIASLKANDLFIAVPGVILPVDAEVFEGSVYIAQFSYEAESELVVKALGQKIRAGSVVKSGTAVMRALSTHKESELSFFLDHVKEVQLDNSNSVRNMNQSLGAIGFSKSQSKALNLYYVLLLFILATSSIYWYQNKAGMAYVLNLMVAGLTLSIFPKLIVFTSFESRVIPLSFFNHGIVYLKSNLWRSFARVKDVFVKDKPEQLFSRYRVSNFTVIDDRIEFSNLLPIVSKMLLMSGESEAYFFADYFESNDVVPNLCDFQDYYVEPGQGIKIVIDNAEVIYGCENFLIKNNVSIQSTDIDQEHIYATKVFIAIGKLPVAYFVVEEVDFSRSDSFLSKLDSLNLNFKILTGIKEKMIKSRAKELNLELKDFFSYDGLNELLALTITQSRDAQNYSIFYPLSKSESYHVDNYDNLLVVGCFDPLEYNLYNFDATIIKQNLEVIPRCIKLAKKIVRAMKISDVFMVFSSVLLLVAICTFSIPAWKVACMVNLVMVFLYCYRLFQFR